MLDADRWRLRREGRECFRVDGRAQSGEGGPNKLGGLDARGLDHSERGGVEYAERELVREEEEDLVVEPLDSRDAACEG